MGAEPQPGTRRSDADPDDTLPGDAHDRPTLGSTAGDPAGAASERPGRARTPEMLGRYVLLAPLGAGGMGEVYAAYDPELDRKVAIKVVRTGRDRSERAVARLRREAQALAKLSHPHVVPIFDVGSEGGRIYFAMELVRGATLDRWCADKVGDVGAIVPRFVDAARGLQAAHDAGIVHRDVKPENLLLGEDGRVRVLDLGIAKLAGAATDLAESEAEDPTTVASQRPGIDPSAETAQALYATRLTSWGAVMGTPAFMSPEQYEGTNIDARSDQFSFCASLFCCLYGEAPFQADSYTGMCAAIVGGELVEAKREAEVPVRIRDAIRRGLSVRPEDRFPDMDGLIAELEPPPTRRGRGVFAVAFVLVIASLAAWNVVSPPTPALTCEVPDADLDAIWSPQLERRVRRASEREAAADHFVARAQSWRSNYAHTARLSCEQTRREGKFSADVLDARTRCLDRRVARWRSRLDAIVGADGLSSDTLFELAPDPIEPERCLDVVTATGELDGPGVDAKHRLEWASRLARARTDLKLGNVDAATASAREVVEAASESHRVLAEAHLILGLSARDRIDAGDPAALEPALDHLAEAAAQADRAADDGLRAEIYIELVHLSGHHQRRIDEAQSFVTLAEGALDRMGGRGLEQRFRLSEHHGLALFATGHAKQAVGQFRLARAAYEALHDGQVSSADPIAARLASNLGNALLASGDLESAVRENRLALDRAVKAYGERHPLTCGVLNNFGVALHEFGDHREARSTHERSLACREAVYGADSAQLANAEAGVGLANLELGELEAAREHLRAAKRLRGRGGRPEDEAETAFGLARALAEQDPSAAHTLANEALMLYAQVTTQPSKRKAVQAWLSEHPAP